jgi:hypothetical protein
VRVGLPVCIASDRGPDHGPPSAVQVLGQRVENAVVVSAVETPGRVRDVVAGVDWVGLDDVEHGEQGVAVDPVFSLVSVVVFLGDGFGRVAENVDAVFGFADVSPLALPGAESSDRGCVGPLGEDQEHIIQAVPVERSRERQKPFPMVAVTLLLHLVGDGGVESPGACSDFFGAASGCAGGGHIVFSFFSVRLCVGLFRREDLWLLGPPA